MSNFVKGINSDHLVAVGDTGVDWAALPDTTRLDQLLAVTNIDYASLHLYPYWGCGSSQSMVAAAVCRLEHDDPDKSRVYRWKAFSPDGVRSQAG